MVFEVTTHPLGSSTTSMSVSRLNTSEAVIHLETFSKTFWQTIICHIKAVAKQLVGPKSCVKKKKKKVTYWEDPFPGDHREEITDEESIVIFRLGETSIVKKALNK